MMLSVAFHLLLLASTFIGAFEGDMSEAGLVSPLDGPDPGYIIAGSKDGLGNRLRALAGFIYIAEQHYSGAHLVFDWDVNSACPGHFLTLLEPLPQVTFISNSSRTLFDKHAKGVYSQSSANFRWILQSHQLPNNVSARNIIYTQFKPRRQFVDIAKAFVIKHDICNGSVIHMRMTDMDKILHPFHRQNLQKHMWYVESRPREEKIFLMSDDPSVQPTFLKEFGEEKVAVYDKINQTTSQHLLPAVPVAGGLPATASQRCQKTIGLIR